MVSYIQKEAEAAERRQTHQLENTERRRGKEPTLQSQQNNPLWEFLERRRFPLRSSLKELEVLLPGGRFPFPLLAVQHLYDTGRINEAASLGKGISFPCAGSSLRYSRVLGAA